MTDEPEKIFFDVNEAFNNEYEYIDSFDENGEKVCSYKMIKNGKYTTDF